MESDQSTAQKLIIMPKEIIILTDNREQKPWFFEKETKARSGYKSIITNCESATIDAADYTIKGYEDLIRIEKKAGFREIMGNYTPKENQERFVREMEKLKNVKHKYLVLETSLSNDIMGLSVQQMSVPCSRLIDWIYSLEQEYGIVPIFAGDAGKKISRVLFEMVTKRYL